jgi:predicted dehydrogenase
MNKLRWGVISTARIGIQKVIPALQGGKHSTVTAIASRDLAKAQAAAKALGLPKAYGSYEEILADPDVDAVYIGLPNHLHVPWSIQALQAGKHVLCEKPIALNATEAQQLLTVAQQHPRLKIMEAFMYRFHPQWQRARELVNTGQIGELRTIQSCFSYRNVDPQNIRNLADIGGGGLLDIGCYCISLSRFIFDAEPQRVLGVAGFDPQFKTDILASGLLEFARGTATFTCGTQMAPYQRVNIFGSEGRVEIEIPFNAPPDEPRKIWHQRGYAVSAIEVGAHDQYRIQGDQFSLAVLEDRPVPTPLTDAVANMRVIDAVFRSARTGVWV